MDSNQGPVVYKTTALPTELCLHGLNIAHILIDIKTHIYMESHTSIIPEITQEELEAIERLFKFNLHPSLIDLAEYKEICKHDETATELLEELVEKCLDYTVDVSVMERFTRENEGIRDEDFDTITNKRKATHDAMIASINIFSRYILNNKLTEESFVTWDSSSRVGYGRFALLLTLNIFKEKILLDLVKKKSTDEINIEDLRQSADDQELLVIDYVDILCKAEKEDRELTEDEKDTLQKIEKTLNQTSDKILGAFHEIYIRRY